MGHSLYTCTYAVLNDSGSSVFLSDADKVSCVLNKLYSACIILCGVQLFAHGIVVRLQWRVQAGAKGA